MKKMKVLSCLLTIFLLSSCSSLTPSSGGYSDRSVSNDVDSNSPTSGSVAIDDSTVSVDTSTTPLEIYVNEIISYYGDCIYMKYGDYDILIDGAWATDGTRINSFIKTKMNDDTIDLLIATHPHADHIAGIANAISGLKVKTLIDFGISSYNTSYNNCRTTLVNGGTKWIKYYDAIYKQNGATNQYDLAGDLKLTILNTGNYTSSGSYTYDNNALSVPTLFTLNKFTFLTMGDCTGDCEHYMVNNESLLPRDVSLFKLDHHGSTSKEGSYANSESSGSGNYMTNSQEFLNYVNPKAVFISASRPLDYSTASSGGVQDTASTNKTCEGAHPAAATLKRVYSLANISVSKNVYWNMYAGTMQFVSYGQDIALEMKGAGPQCGYYASESDTSIVTGENNMRLHETKIWQLRGYSMN